MKSRAQLLAEIVLPMIVYVFMLNLLSFPSVMGDQKNQHPFDKQTSQRGVSADGNHFTGWVDPDTEEKYWTIKSFVNGDMYDIVMSDEFEVSGRTFADGDDPKWCALDKSDDDQTAQGKKSLQYYNSSQVTTRDGKLIIQTNDEDTAWREFNPCVC